MLIRKVNSNKEEISKPKWKKEAMQSKEGKLWIWGEMKGERDWCSFNITRTFLIHIHNSRKKRTGRTENQNQYTKSGKHFLLE